MRCLKILAKAIRNSSHILVATHIDPDGDGIAAALACGRLVRYVKKCRPTLFCHSPIPDKYNFLLDGCRFEKRPDDFDLLIAVDTPRFSRIFPNLDDLELARLSSRKVVNIDHHQSNDSFGKIRIIDAAASSVCEIIYYIYKGLDIRIDRRLAEIIYCGIYSDTGGFVYPNTTPKALKIASELVGLGVQPGPLVKQLNAKSLVGTRLLSQVLDTIDIKGVVGSMFLTRRMLETSGANMSDSENFISFLQAIEGVRVSLFLREEEDGTRVSLRSDGIIDVDEIARQFGGGGHRLAAGIRLKKNLAPVKKDILQALLKELKKRS